MIAHTLESRCELSRRDKSTMIVALTGVEMSCEMNAVQLGRQSLRYV